MLSRGTKVRLLLFAMIAVVGIVYVGGTYAGLDRLFGTRGYRVTVQLADSGGIFTNAEVTYRGVAVGRVERLRLSDDGIDVVLDIEDDAPPIPADTRAVVANRSAVGEQYVDLRPEHASGPYLAEGSVVPRDRTSTPSSPETQLSQNAPFGGKPVEVPPPSSAPKASFGTLSVPKASFGACPVSAQRPQGRKPPRIGTGLKGQAPRVQRAPTEHQPLPNTKDQVDKRKQWQSTPWSNPRWNTNAPASRPLRTRRTVSCRTPWCRSARRSRG